MLYVVRIAQIQTILMTGVLTALQLRVMDAGRWVMFTVPICAGLKAKSVIIAISWIILKEYVFLLNDIVKLIVDNRNLLTLANLPIVPLTR